MHICLTVKMLGTESKHSLEMIYTKDNHGFRGWPIVGLLFKPRYTHYRGTWKVVFYCHKNCCKKLSKFNGLVSKGRWFINSLVCTKSALIITRPHNMEDEKEGTFILLRIFEKYYTTSHWRLLLLSNLNPKNLWRHLLSHLVNGWHIFRKDELLQSPIIKSHEAWKVTGPSWKHPKITTDFFVSAEFFQIKDNRGKMVLVSVSIITRISLTT